MANQVTNYKCPACTGPLRFDSATGKLQCDFCGSSYEVAEIEKLYAEKDAQAAGAFRQAEEQAAADGEWTSASGSDWGADAEKLRVYSCPSCGAELPEAGELLYHGSGAAPVYLIANESDIMPNTQVTVTAADGTAIIYQPFLSLRDGSLAVPEDGTVYDFTVYPEGFVRETTA